MPMERAFPGSSSRTSSRRTITSRADPDLGAAGLDWRKADALAADREVLPGEVHLRARPETADDLHAFLVTARPVGERDAERLELVLPVAHAEAGDHASAGDVVEGRVVLGHRDRVTERQDEHVR